MPTEVTAKKFPIAFAIKLIAMVIVVLVVLNIKEATEQEWIYQMIKGVSTFLIPSLVISIIRFFVLSFYHAKHRDRAVRGNFVLGINRLSTMLNVIFAIIALMVGFGINPLELLMSMTIVAMAIAVTFRDYITNMISGLFIMFSDEISVGDRIRIGEHKGRIVDVTFASIIMQNEEDDMVMIPNNVAFTQAFVNLSAHRSNLFNVKFELPLSLAVDIEKLETELYEAFVNHPNLDKENDFKLKVVQIGKDFVSYRIELHAVSSSNQLHRKLENEILKHILVFERQYVKSFEP